VTNEKLSEIETERNQEKDVDGDITVADVDDAGAGGGSDGSSFDKDRPLSARTSEPCKHGDSRHYTLQSDPN